MKKIILLLITAFYLFSCAAQPSSTVEVLRDDRPKLEPVKPKVTENEVRHYYPPPKEIDDNSGAFTYSDVPQVKIALLVPLSGKYQKLGQNLLDAAQLAVFNIGESNLVLIPIDTKGTAYGALDAAKSAINQGVSLIVGPVFSGSAKSIAQLAGKSGISVISFSNDKSLAGSGVFIGGFIPEQQIRRAIEFSLSQGIEDFTAILPNNFYGAASAKELRETIEKYRNASVIRTEIYQLEANGSIKNAVNHIYPVFNAAMKTRSPSDYNEVTKEYTDSPITYPRAMLIPEGGKNLADISTYLDKYHLDKNYIQLIGSSQWYDNSLLTNQILNGAWFAIPPTKKQQEFKEEFIKTYNYEPADLASLSYDFISLAATIARTSDSNGFTRDAIANPRGFAGVGGIFRFNQDGMNERGFEIMQIQNGQFVVIDPAPDSFFEVEKVE